MTTPFVKPAWTGELAGRGRERDLERRG